MDEMNVHGGANRWVGQGLTPPPPKHHHSIHSFIKQAFIGILFIV